MDGSVASQLNEVSESENSLPMLRFPRGTNTEGLGFLWRDRWIDGTLDG